MIDFVFQNFSAPAVSMHQSPRVLDVRAKNTYIDCLALNDLLDDLLNLSQSTASMKLSGGIFESNVKVLSIVVVPGVLVLFEEYKAHRLDSCLNLLLPPEVYVNLAHPRRL